MNDVIRQLDARKSVRAFTDQPIEEVSVQAILRAAVMAPTAGNQQLYTILRMTDPGLLSRLADACDHQPFIARGKLVLVFCADCLKWYDAFASVGCAPRKPGPGDLLLAVDDALIAAQNAVTAAESLGIGSCYIGDVMENSAGIRALLRLPRYVFPAALVVFGYPTVQQRERRKPLRSPLDQIVQENVYHRRTPEELRTMLAPKAGREELEAWLRAFCERKYHSDFALEMNRSVAEYLEDFAAIPGE